MSENDAIRQTAEAVLAIDGLARDWEYPALRDLKALAREYLLMIEEYASCDVVGCDNEATSGGMYWQESGYWRICSQHGYWARQSKPQPTMKPAAVAKEATRDPVTGYLP